MRFALDAAPNAQEGAVAQAIDEANKKVRSLDGALAWDFAVGVVKLDAAKAQGAAGFLSKAGVIACKDLSLECVNEYATVLAVALDGQPLAESKKILLQVATEEQPYGFRAENGRITAMGGAPYGMKHVTGKVTFKQGGALKVTALDENGYATTKKVPVTGVPMDLLPDVMHYIIER